MKAEDKKIVEAFAKRRVRLKKLKRMQPRGIYFLMEDGEIVYIGQSVNVLSRVSGHYQDKSFDLVEYFEWGGELNCIEEALIAHFKPKLNRQIKIGKPLGNHGSHWACMQQSKLRLAREAIAECLRVYGIEDSRERAQKWNPKFALSSI